MRFNQQVQPVSSVGVRAARPGSMFVETAIGITLAAIVMVGVAQLVALSARQRREVAHARIATEEVANTMEQVMILPWGDLSDEAVEDLKVSEDLAGQLEDPQLSIRIETFEDELLTKKIEVLLSWKDQAARRVKPVRVVAWRHRAPDGEASESE